MFLWGCLCVLALGERTCTLTEQVYPVARIINQAEKMVEKEMKAHPSKAEQNHGIGFLDAAIVRILPPGGLVLDIGLNDNPGACFQALRNGNVCVGFEPGSTYTHAVHLIKSAGFEVEEVDVNKSIPSKFTLASKPYKNFEGNMTSAKAYLFNAGVSNKSGSLHLTRFSGKASRRSVLRDAASSNTYEVPVVTLDDVIKQDVMFMKIDVQGHEPFVYQGAKNLFSQHSVALIYAELEFQIGRKNSKRYTLATRKQLEILADSGFVCDDIRDLTIDATAWDFKSRVNAYVRYLIQSGKGVKLAVPSTDVLCRQVCRPTRLVGEMETAPPPALS